MLWFVSLADVPDSVARRDGKRRPDLHIWLDCFRRDGFREQKVREHAIRAPGAHGHGRLGANGSAVPSPSQLIPRLDVEVNDRLVEVEPAFWIEGVDHHIFVHFPGIEGGHRALGEESIRLNTAPPRVIASQDDLSREEVVREPDLVLGEEPVRVVALVELSKGCAWIGRRDPQAWDVALDVPLPRQV